MRKAVFRCALILASFALPWLVTIPAFGQGRPTFDETLPPPDMSGLRMTPAQARTPDDFFAVFDADDNGCIDRSEWRRRIMAIFFALDTEGGGETASVAGVAVPGDEMLTRRELPNLSEEAFLAADVDKDGKISAYEFNQAPWTRYEAANPAIVGCLDKEMFRRFFESLRD